MVPEQICCVCNGPVSGPARTLGGRTFCERHYVSATRDRKGLWVAAIALVVGLILFVAVAQLLAPWLGAAPPGAWLALAGALLALVPAAIWLTAFYLQDRTEPEPKSYLLGVFFLGALLAAAVGQPLINSVFRVDEWAWYSLAIRLIAGVCVVGAIQSFLTYAAVRYTVYNSPEFDEKVDGIIYGAAAGVGYATTLNLAYVLQEGGVDPAIAAIRIAVAALAQASFAGVTGYFLGRAKFEARGPLWLPAGVLLAALLNGVVTVALGEIGRSGLRATPINGLILAGIVAGATFAVLYAIMRAAAARQAAPGAPP
jgi:RsiW-degrading membrane proteinase PrsW (M82 family)